MAVGADLSPSTKDDDLASKKIGEYDILNRIGSGGMGVVWEGVQPIIGKRVAVKVLRPHLSQDRALVERFLAEARAVNAIRHRGIVDIFSFGELSSGARYFVMEYLEGQPFDRLIKDRAPILPYDVMSWTEEVLDALDAVHASKIIHRDIKPSNLFLVNTGRGKPYVKLLDFGVAKLSSLIGEATPQTRASVLVGTPDYMAPEQARGEKIGPGTDIYAVGCVVFEMLTGRRVFVGENPMQVMYKHVEHPPPRVSSLVPDIPGELDDLVLSMLDKNASRRPSNAGELRKQVEELRKILPAEKTEHAAPPRSATPKPFRDRPISEILETRVAPATEPPVSVPDRTRVDIHPPMGAEPTNPERPKQAAASQVRMMAMLGFFALATGGLVFGYMVLLSKPAPVRELVELQAQPEEPRAEPAPEPAVYEEPPPEPPPAAMVAEQRAAPEPSAAKPKRSGAKGRAQGDLEARLRSLGQRLEKKDTERGSKDRVLHQFLDQATARVNGAKSEEDRRDAWKFLGELDKQIGP
jgi:serine/threonine protein kinase